MPKFIDMAGKRYGHLLVERLSHKDSDGAHWRCLCDCGRSTVMRGKDIRQGKSLACGCLRGFAARRHGHAINRKPSATYNSWVSMHQRCGNPKDPSYKDYGATGITICDRWKSFDNFLTDMGERPDGTSLDRYPNQRGNYEPSNCRWATPGEQLRNTRRTRMVTHNGTTMCASDWADRLGMPRHRLYARLNTMSVDIALTLPYRGRK